MNAPDLLDLLWQGLGETAYMVGVATLLSGAGGLLIGVLLVLTDRGGLLAAPPLNTLLGLIVNIGRSLPFMEELLHSPEVKTFIEDKYKGSVLPAF
ncbi:hypothetical protein [Micromonospora narathiwatensis]|uniref:Uncharacterized protein n=1 Tax=Micromonospora narathiwatensis TaxID=299146 RepID=A0A1A8ZHZ3_9ACTN|nr:hypothetical protein [Micromonospora narathiwatensis]SBT43648.1 hypothetical protein GA0070621_1848 [Micromonospora narathiwatensis]